ncbi:MAG TPA: hypothetical protein VE864_04035, partial [Streptosporangiaceae bacterium]|nr:hypothetical protein [Streptosporangiaceae bacterium]
DAGQPEHRQVAGTGTRLDLAETQLAVDMLDLLADVENAAAKIDVLPAHASTSPRRMPYSSRSTNAG